MLKILIKEFILHGILLALALITLAISTAYFEHLNSVNNVDKTHELFTLNEFYSSEKPSLDLSFVVPCYKEKLRLPKMLSSTIKYMNNTLPLVNFEFILINDGSPDDTWSVIKNLIIENKNIKIKGVNYNQNSGKGYAVRTGVKYTQGDYILMLDADGATDTKEINKFLSHIKLTAENKTKKSIIIASRNLLGNTAERPWYRRLPSLVNNLFVTKLIGIKGIKDTQCGFKIFTKESAKELFSKMHLNRWAFDIELLYLAQKNDFNIQEVPVVWNEIEGGNLFVFQATVSFFRDYLALFSFYNSGIWVI